MLSRLVVALAVPCAALGGATAAPSAGQIEARLCAPGAPADRADPVPAHSIHVIYAAPADAPDRVAERGNAIVRDLAAVDAWWRVRDPARAPRFDLLDAACETDVGRLDLSVVRLPGDNAWYGATNDPYRRIVDEANRPAGQFDDPDKKYLLFYEGSVPRAACGTSTREPEGGNRSTAVIYLGSVCGATLGAETWNAVVTAHELLHTLGALGPPVRGIGPPHACSLDAGHPCDSAGDILYPRGRSTDVLAAKELDAGRDDYYGHQGPWLDVRDSLFLARLDTADWAPPVGPGSVTATSRRTTVVVSWPAARAAGGVTYRVYRDGRLLDTTADTDEVDSALPGSTIVYGVRAVDGAGLLGPLRTARFTVGLGLVDESGRLVRDTVPPDGVASLSATVRGRTVVLRWRPAADAGGLAGYRVLRDGRRVRNLVRGTTERLSRGGRGAVWTVRAIDRSGNLGEPATAFA